MTMVMFYENATCSAYKNIPLPSMGSSVKAVITVQNSAQPTQSTCNKWKAFFTFLTNTNNSLKLVYTTRSCLHKRQYKSSLGHMIICIIYQIHFIYIYIYTHPQIFYQECQNLIAKVRKFQYTLNSGSNSYTLK